MRGPNVSDHPPRPRLKRGPYSSNGIGLTARRDGALDRAACAQYPSAANSPRRDSENSARRRCVVHAELGEERY
jgi:hypothetical protein